MQNNLSNFKIGDRQKTWGRIFGYGIIAGILGLIGYYVFPIITEIIYNTVYLAIAAVVAFVLYIILASKKFWLGLELIGAAIARWTLGAIIEMDPWNVMYYKVEQSEKDREDLREQTDLLKGQEAKLKDQINQNNYEMKEASASIKILQGKLQQDPSNDENALLLEKCTNDFSMAKSFIDSVTPIHNDIQKLIVFAEKAYNKSGTEIQIAKNTIKKNKALYEAVTTGSNAMSKAMRAFTGRKDLNDASDIALENLRTDIGNKIGKIKTSIQITSQFMNERDLKDAAKVANAVETMQMLDNDKSVPYSATINASHMDVKAEKVGNKYLDMLNNKK